MKRLLTAILLAFIITSTFPATFFAASTSSTPIPLNQRLIGTWMWDDGLWTIVFRDDGVMFDGVPGMQTTRAWRADGDRLFVDGIDWNIRLSGETMTVDRDGISWISYTYTRHSDATDGGFAIAGWLFAFVAGFAALVVIGGTIAIILIVRNHRRKMENSNK